MQIINENIDMNYRVLKVSTSMILLLIGGILYIAFRTKTLLMFKWAEWLHLDTYVEVMRLHANQYNPPYFIRYCLPNTLWIISYMIMIDALVSKNDYKIRWILALPFIAILFEILQNWEIIPGTFDIWDLLSLVIPTIVYATKYYMNYEKNI